MSVSPILRLRDAAFGYDGRAVVSGVSLEVNPGEIIAVLGPNGSGKSTLMRGILGLNDHVSGQVELFGTPHLRNVQQPGALHYDFARHGPAPFTDRVTVHVREVRADGTRDVAFDFLTGERRESHPPVEGFSGNPVLMIFLEHDVRTLKESIGVSTTYWRNRLRDALLQSATVEDVTATVDGRTVPARKVSVRPFEGEDRLRRVPPVRDKLYTFILADAVPGGIVEIRTDMPADAGLGVPAAGESLVFNRTLAQDVPGAAKP